MPSVAKANPGFWVVVCTEGQSTPSGDVTQRPHPNREMIMSLCTIVYADSHNYQLVQSHYMSDWANWSCSPFQRMKESIIKKSIYVVLLHLIIIHDANSFEVWHSAEPHSFPFQAPIHALRLTISAPQSHTLLSVKWRK